METETQLREQFPELWDDFEADVAKGPGGSRMLASSYGTYPMPKNVCRWFFNWLVHENMIKSNLIIPELKDD